MNHYTMDTHVGTKSAMYQRRHEINSPKQALHSKDAKLSATRLDFVPAAHSSAESQTKITPCVLGWDYAVILNAQY